jgi:hypothetical protein
MPIQIRREGRFRVVFWPCEQRFALQQRDRFGWLNIPREKVTRMLFTLGWAWGK